jgi:hypothetical protein
VSTSGYLIEYDVPAFERHVLPLAGKDAGAIVDALEAHPDAAHWDDETREIIDEADDVNDLLRLAFSAWCVPADATVVPLGRYVTLREFEREFEALDASAALRAAIASWVQPPKGAWRIDDEFELKPATRTMLEELWRQAAPLGLTPLDDAGAEQLQRADGGDARTTLAWFGRVLQTPGRSVAFFYESLRAPQQKEPKRNDTLVVVLQDLLAQEGLTPWDYVHEGAGELTWRITAEGTAVAHATVMLEDGVQRWVTWRKEKFLNRLFGAKGPRPDEQGLGACPDSGCAVCRAATRAAAFLKQK